MVIITVENPLSRSRSTAAETRSEAMWPQDVMMMILANVKR